MKIASVVRKVEFISDGMLYIILRGHWCNIIVLNMHALGADESDDVMGSFYEELGCVFDKILGMI
jgi:hypothetical protein